MNPKDYFDQSKIQVFDFETVPIAEEIWLMDERWMKELGPAIAANEGLFDIGCNTKAIVHNIGPDALELSIYLNQIRFHEIRAFLPRDQFVLAVDRPEYHIKPRMFVKSSWLSDLHLRNHSVFAIFDAIGVKEALTKGVITCDRLVQLRERIDRTADEHPDVALISFADSLLVKTNFALGQYDSPIRYSYEPERIIKLFSHIRDAFREVLGFGVYAIVTQGVNEDGNPSLLHISRDHNHISLNTLGLPFAQLLAIDRAVRQRIHAKTHPPTDLYMDRSFYHLLQFVWGRFDKNARPRYSYDSPMGESESHYFAESFETIGAGLRRSDEAASW